jgi:pimeloyl-ACP methyl ester carboxylesterase
VETPSKAQNSRLVSVTTTTNLCDSVAGTSLWDSGARGAPIRCGSAIRPRPSTAAHAAERWYPRGGLCHQPVGTGEFLGRAIESGRRRHVLRQRNDLAFHASGCLSCGSFAARHGDGQPDVCAHRIPTQLTSPTPIVLVHGGGLTGASYETTPDGREGWATYLARKGYAVYVVDAPGRGRSGFNATAINQAKAESSVAPLPSNVLMVPTELAWPLFRFGPTNRTAYPDTQFPTDAFAAFGSQGVPFGGATLEGGAMATAPRALAALLDKIGPAVVVVHSLAGPFADALVETRPRLVKAVVNIEGAHVPTEAQIEAYQGIPVLELFGDHLDSTVFTGRPRYEGRKAVVERINKQQEGKATLVRLPEVGIKGNSHMMMQDKNNLQVADFVLRWIASNISSDARHYMGFIIDGKRASTCVQIALRRGMRDDGSRAENCTMNRIRNELKQSPRPVPVGGDLGRL